jgi:hypothetical protein
MQLAFPYDCFKHRLPLNIGCETADTVINTIESDGSSTLYFGGWTECPEYQATSATKSALIGKSDTS